MGRISVCLFWLGVLGLAGCMKHTFELPESDLSDLTIRDKAVNIGDHCGCGELAAKRDADRRWWESWWRSMAWIVAVLFALIGIYIFFGVARLLRCAGCCHALQT